MFISTCPLFQYGDHIYWTSLFKKTVERAEKETGRMRTTFHTALHGVMELRFVSASKQQGVNPCSVFNGYCSHLCLYLGGINYACACPDEPDSTPCSTGDFYTQSEINWKHTYIRLLLSWRAALQQLSVLKIKRKISCNVFVSTNLNYFQKKSLSLNMISHKS